MNSDKGRLDEITRSIIGTSYDVSNALGSGFLEKVYENALAHELHKKGFEVRQQRQLMFGMTGFVSAIISRIY